MVVTSFLLLYLSSVQFVYKEVKKLMNSNEL